jgi:hypothetical protein
VREAIARADEVNPVGALPVSVTELVTVAAATDPDSHSDREADR